MEQELPFSARRTWFFAAALCISGLLSAPATSVWGQVTAPAAEVHGKSDISGDWQGTLTLQNEKTLRIIVRFSHTDNGLAAKWYSIDEDGQPVSVSSVTVSGVKVRLIIDMLTGTYEGVLSADGASMTGTWTQDSESLPLTLVRATKMMAWEIPSPRPPMKSMLEAADPTFDVATIKPNNSGAANMTMLRFGEDDFETRNASLVNLIAYAYDVQAKQIVGGPEWMSRDRYDIRAKADRAGVPTPTQQRSLVRKLLSDRFKLTLHTDKKEMSAYVLAVVKAGAKLKQTDFAGPGMSFGFVPESGGITFPMRNATMSEFSEVLQSMVLDRPVVNSTGLTDKYDFAVKFMPDESQFNGSPPVRKAQTDVNDSPTLFEAMQQQLGLKLETHTTLVKVIAINHIERPSAN